MPREARVADSRPVTTTETRYQTVLNDWAAVEAAVRKRHRQSVSEVVNGWKPAG